MKNQLLLIRTTGMAYYSWKHQKTVVESEVENIDIDEDT